MNELLDNIIVEYNCLHGGWYEYFLGTRLIAIECLSGEIEYVLNGQLLEKDIRRIKNLTDHVCLIVNIKNRVSLM